MVNTAGPGSSQTNWSMIHQAAHGTDLPAAADALDQLVRRYWPAVYAYIRSAGRSVDEAADLAQGFVCDVVLGRGLFQHADPGRGRFRTLLLTSLKHYLVEVHRRDSRIKRAGNDRKPLTISQADIDAAEQHATQSPEAAFCAQWNATMIRRVLERVRAGCLAGGMDAHWAVFEARVIRPLLFGETRGPYSRLIERLGLTSAAQAANMMLSVKRRFARELYAEVAQTVSDPMQTDDELRELLRELEQPS
jgi:DNA-directed RNA polymerase specialized sigma24 family protein